MERQRSALLVDGGPAKESTVDALKAGGIRVTTARSFQQAADLVVSEPPDALITELRLGAFNGLHLIMRLRDHSPHSVAIVYTAFPDPVLEEQARQLGANYLVQGEDGSALVDLLATRTDTRERRSGGRKKVARPIVAMVASTPARLVDICSDGFCVEVQRGLVESLVEMRVPDYDVSITARVVWARRTHDGVEGLRLGASLSNVAPATALRWRQLVEST